MVLFARRVIRLWSICILCVIFLISCTSQPVVLTGIVTDAYTGAPIPNATVSIGDLTLTTDDQGRFQTERWRLEDTLALQAPAYEPTSLPLADQPGVGVSGVLTVTITTALRPNTLVGQVIDAYTGQPIRNAEVILNDTEPPLTTTNENGQYTLTDVLETFSITVRADEYASVRETLSRTTTFDVKLRPNILRGQVTNMYTGEPVAGATVKLSDLSVTTDAEGRYVLHGVTETGEIIVEADGFATVTRPFTRTTKLDVAIRPDTLFGQLIDATTGKPVQNAAIIATETLTSTALTFVRINDSIEGRFRLPNLPERGFVQVLAPGYAKRVIPIEPGNMPQQIELEPFYVRGIYITAAVASVPRLVDRFLDLIDRTELNTLIIDIKSDLRDDLGMVYYDSQVPLAKELGLSTPRVDFRSILAKAKERGIYTIARVQLFSHDNALSDARPEWSIRLRSTGEVYADYPGPGIRYAYLDPTNQNVWDYNIALAVEAAQMGFDEINFDYIRFPDWFGTRDEFRDKLLFSEPIDPVGNPGRMYEVILEFMQRAHQAVNAAGAFMSVDIFGRVVNGPSLTIAQDMTRMGEHTDYVCPMPYPSLWWSGLDNIAVPVKYPYETIQIAVRKGGRLMADSYARQRPWLQDHTDPWAPVVVEYGPAEVRAQINATEEQPEAASGWMLYDSANIYKGAFNGAVRPAP
ncbi:putative glycoside hydrolase [Chloroflexus sp. Y-396-1]|uniref:putative glycoside hydrolase n=1 Tax=Chloroflexus sp. Y-396-1 TaxID=867845 RepID=UPI00048CB21F|nr:putative glycoside hydrolase [Chloroflexus sp. Y-396-1]